MNRVSTEILLRKGIDGSEVAIGNALLITLNAFEYSFRKKYKRGPSDYDLELFSRDKCLEACLFSSLYLERRAKQHFESVSLLRLEPLMLSPFRRDPNLKLNESQRMWRYHYYFLAHSYCDVYYAGSPANYIAEANFNPFSSYFEESTRELISQQIINFEGGYIANEEVLWDSSRSLEQTYGRKVRFYI